jgi:predicted transglutaminase-like protease
MRTCVKFLSNFCGYPEKRAKKDVSNREKGIKRLKRDYGNGKITKEQIDRRGYNKFLELMDNVKISINQEKITEDVKWDGLKDQYYQYESSRTRSFMSNTAVYVSLKELAG